MIVNILTFHALMAPSGLPLALFVAALWALIFVDSDRTILITGVTGKQGGAVAQALKSTGFHLRGLTRRPDSDLAAALVRDGIEMVKGDLDDESSLHRALAGTWSVFGAQNAGEAGVEREEAQGKRRATLARESGVEHYVYTSVPQPLHS